MRPPPRAADAAVEDTPLDARGTCAAIEGMPCACGVWRCVGEIPACVCTIDAGADVAVDTTRAVDAGRVDAATEDAAAPDVTQEDVRVVDVNPRTTETCRGVNAWCDGRRVNVQGGERDGSVTHHCGACGVTCAVGEFCVSCVCER